MIGDDSLLTGKFFHRLAYHPCGRTPANQRDLCVRRSEYSRWLQQGQNPLHFSHALFMDRPALVGIREFVADEHAVLIVLVCSHYVRVPRRARQGAWRDAALGDFVALIVTVGRWRISV